MRHVVYPLLVANGKPDRVIQSNKVIPSQRRTVAGDKIFRSSISEYTHSSPSPPLSPLPLTFHHSIRPSSRSPVHCTTFPCARNFLQPTARVFRLRDYPKRIDRDSHSVRETAQGQKASMRRTLDSSDNSLASVRALLPLEQAVANLAAAREVGETSRLLRRTRTSEIHKPAFLAILSSTIYSGLGIVARQICWS